jgi:endogenous inhibitor of DNA gyrase (YacG/DUF329 family)
MTTTQSFKVDLRKYKPGICVGFEKVIVECPLCGKGGAARRGGIRPAVWDAVSAGKLVVKHEGGESGGLCEHEQSRMNCPACIAKHEGGEHG